MKNFLKKIMMLVMAFHWVPTDLCSVVKRPRATINSARKSLKFKKIVPPSYKHFFASLQKNKYFKPLAIGGVTGLALLSLGWLLTDKSAPASGAPLVPPVSPAPTGALAAITPAVPVFVAPTSTQEARVASGLLLGALGDLLGVSLEFRDLYGGRRDNLKPLRGSSVSDDTSWSLLLADSLICNSYKIVPQDIMRQRFEWLAHGRAAAMVGAHELSHHFNYCGKTGKLNRSAFYFGPGIKVVAKGYGRAGINAIDRWAGQYAEGGLHRDSYSSHYNTGQLNLDSKGNGTLMSLLPATAACWNKTEAEAMQYAMDLSWCCHQNPTAVETARLLALLQYRLINRNPAVTISLIDLIAQTVNDFRPSLFVEYTKRGVTYSETCKEWFEMQCDIADLKGFILNLQSRITKNVQPLEFINNYFDIKLSSDRKQYFDAAGKPFVFTGDVVTSLKVAFWAAAYGERMGPSPAISTIKLAVCLGGDTDTFAAIAGHLAGCYYGSSDSMLLSWAQQYLGNNFVSLLQSAAQCLVHHNRNGWSSAMLDRENFSRICRR